MVSMASFDAAAVAALLREFAQRSTLRGGNPYRAKAYARAADSLGALAQPLDRLIAERRLEEIPGVGAAIADIITKLHRTGTHPSLESMRKDIPGGVLEMLSVPGLRPDKVLKLYKELGITSLAELEAAARADRLKRVKGLGPALQAKILQNIEIGRSGEGRYHLHRAALLLENAERSLRQAHPELTRITPAGDFRRSCELVAHLALVAEAPALASGPAMLKTGGALSVHLTDKQHYGATLLAATGSSDHLEQLQQLAHREGLTLSAEGLKRGHKTIAASTEEDIYKTLRLPFIAPELREGRDEIERALAGELPHLVTDDDIRGILHAHPICQTARIRST
jgi:DNA polymerase (family 10)